MNPEVRRGVELFNQGRYWEAHEAWETAWTPERHGPDRGFYKGLIQIAAGCLHSTRSNRRGTVNKWRSGLELVGPYPDGYHGVRLHALAAAISELLARVEASPGWPPLELPRIGLDEPENAQE